MLNTAEDQARKRKWAVVSETATPGFVARIRDTHLPALLAELDPPRFRFTGVTAPGNLGGATWQTTTSYPVDADLRTRAMLAADLLAQRRAGLLITLDEIHSVTVPELRQLGTVVQHAFREGRELAFAGAGLSGAVSDLLKDFQLTFLRRAERHHLGKVPGPEVAHALREPIRTAGGAVSDDALSVMTEGTEGYPFLIQLIGHRSWIAADDGAIDRDTALRGVADARRRLGSLVHEPALGDCSEVDKTFLVAMAHDNGPSQIGEVQRRMGVDKYYAASYRRRLIAKELISPAGRGLVAFTIPGIGDYLREHAVSDLDW
jgi:hypothetical protein